jgi:lipopolysaccharide export system protein LptC
LSEGQKTSAASKPRTTKRPVASRSRRRVSLAAMRFYSRWVAFLKFVLPAGALALLALVVAWPSLNERPKYTPKADEGSAEIVNPRYLSVDEKNQPYSLTAASAAQTPEHPGLLSLTRPEAEMTDESGAWVTIDAELGWYDRANGVLQMRGSVHVLRDDGSEFTTDEAFSEVRKGTAWGDRHVVGQGPQGEILAQGFRITERGRNVVFLDQSRTVLPGQAEAGGTLFGVPSAAPAAPPQVAAMPPEPPRADPAPAQTEPVPATVLPRVKPTPPAQRVNVLGDDPRSATSKPAKGDRT